MSGDQGGPEGPGRRPRPHHLNLFQGGAQRRVGRRGLCNQRRPGLCPCAPTVCSPGGSHAGSQSAALPLTAAPGASRRARDQRRRRPAWPCPALPWNQRLSPGLGEKTTGHPNHPRPQAAAKTWLWSTSVSAVVNLPNAVASDTAPRAEATSSHTISFVATS